MYIKRIYQGIWIALALVMLTSCSPAVRPDSGGSAGTPDAAAQAQASNMSAPILADSEVVLYPAALDIAVGRSLSLAAEINGGQNAEWKSLDPSVASVSSNGKVSALKTGESMITVTAGGKSDVCRVTVTENGKTLAYLNDPGPKNKDGKRVPPDGQEDNIPLMIPDDQKSVDKAYLTGSEYSWQFIIDDQFDTKLKVPTTEIAYMTNYHIVLDAHKVGGDIMMGDYEGTMKMEVSIDEESFIEAMKALGDFPIIDMNSAIQVKNVDVKFKVVSYESKQINQAKYAFAPAGTNPVLPLVPVPAMAISSAQTSTSGNMEIIGEDGGYGSAALSDKTGKIPLVIEVKSDGKATLYLPRMLAVCERDRFEGVLVRMRLIKTP